MHSAYEKPFLFVFFYSPRLCVLVAVYVKCTSQSLRATEEHTRLCWTVKFPDAPENHVPVWPTEVGRAPQAGDGVLVSVGVVDHDVGRVVCLDLGRQVCVNLNATLHILCLNGEEKRAEPFKRTEVTADPEEVYLGKTGLLLGVVHAVPDRLQNRGEGSDTNTGTHEDGDFVLEHIFGS